MRSLLALFVAMAALASTPFLGAAVAKPNVIFILADDLGYGDLGVFYQNLRREAGDRSAPWHQTPHLDQMAAEGARLTNHYVGAPVCASSRSSLLLGVTQGHANVRDNQFDKALEANHTLATVLHQAGYATAAIGKWGLQGLGSKGPDWPAHPLNRGFDYYYGYMRHVDGHEHYPKESLYFAEKAKERGPIVVWENRTDVTAPLDKCYTTDLWTARAKQWIIDHQHQSPDQPFLLYLAYDTPHAVLELPTQPYPAGGGLHGGMQWLGTPGHMITTAAGAPDSWMHPDYANATYDNDRNAATPEKPWPNINRRYATGVRRIDDGVGDLLQLLKDLHLDENTLVVFTSDNGPSIESYLPDSITPEFFASFGPFDGIKRDCWEGGLRVPTVARWPGHVPAGRVVDVPSGNWDWLPTFAGIAGVPVPARADGISLIPALTGKGRAVPREALYFEYMMSGRTPDFPIFEPGHRNRQRGQMQAIRLGDYMGVRYTVKTAQDDFEIYNVVSDPKEAHNLAVAGNQDQSLMVSAERSVTVKELQRRFKELALQSRRPDEGSPRPYDRELVPADDVHDLKPGVRWQSFDGVFPWVPAFTTMRSRNRGEHPTVTADVTKLAGDAGLLFTGYLQVPADGEYTFVLKTDTGAVLKLHESTLIDADFGYKGSTEKSATIRLEAGPHPFRLAYRHAAAGTPHLALEWTGPDIARQAIPASAFATSP